MGWREQIENISPNTLIEKPDLSVYQANADYFISEGFTREIFAKIFPLAEEQVWSIFQLFKLAKHSPVGGIILEIGSGRGGSIVTMGLANPTAELYNIDKFCPFDEESYAGMLKGYGGFSYLDFQRNIKQFNLNLTTILKWSNDAIDDAPNCDLLFIDGNHTYENCKEDILHYKDKTKILCGHDYHPRFPGVIKAVKEIFGVKFDVLENSSIWIMKD